LTTLVHDICTKLFAAELLVKLKTDEPARSRF